VTRLVRHYGQGATFPPYPLRVFYLPAHGFDSRSGPTLMTTRRGEPTVTRIQRLLAARALTLSAVSRESALRYTTNRAYWIPHNFYARLRAADFNPRIEQLFAFSAITSYRFVDWLAVFGFRLDDLTACASKLPADRTVPLDYSIYDDELEVRWFRSKTVSSALPSIAPLGQFLAPGPSRKIRSLLSGGPSPFLYAKVGRQDAFAFPDLLPGSIVRVDTRLKRKPSNGNPHALYLVDHSNGLTCCRLHFSKGNSVTLRSTGLPYAEVALQLGREVRILGTLDLELRFVASVPSPQVPRDLARFWDPKPLRSLSARPGFAELVTRGRQRMGLSLRQASVRSRLVAEMLNDERFFCATGALAAYERIAAPPRHIFKILALCVLYSLPFRQAVRAASWNVDGLGRDPVPPTALGPGSNVVQARQTHREAEIGAAGLLESVLGEFQEVPFFLRNSLPALLGLPDLSLRDIVWLGGSRSSFHPDLANAVFAAVNRKERKPPSIAQGFLREQPLYLLLCRDGSYLCARCTFQDGRLVVHPFADGFDGPVRLRSGVDAEVVGRVVALLRKL
jgi:hypothetical protein